MTGTGLGGGFLGGVLLFFLGDFLLLSESVPWVLLELSESEELLSEPDPELEPEEDDDEPLPLDPDEELASELDLPTCGENGHKICVKTSTLL